MAFFRMKDKLDPQAGRAARKRRREQLQTQQQMIADQKIPLPISDEL